MFSVTVTIVTDMHVFFLDCSLTFVYCVVIENNEKRTGELATASLEELHWLLHEIFMTVCARRVRRPASQFSCIPQAGSTCIDC